MFIHNSRPVPSYMPRAGAEASVVSVPVLVLVGGVGRYLELRPDVDPLRAVAEEFARL